MNKIGFVYSGIAVIIGVITLLTTRIINLVMPKLGHIAFQAAAAMSYNPRDYHINFFAVDFIAISLIILGIILGYRFYKNEKGRE